LAYIGDDVPLFHAIKQQLKRSSSLYKFLRRIQRREFHLRSRADVFDRIYRTNLWGDPDSVSGDGSNLLATEQLRGALPTLLSDLHIRSILDAPCGDFHWMQHVPLDGIEYVGVDIVADLIANNVACYGQPGRSFEVLDLVVDEIPNVDLILCRDCLIHLPQADVIHVLQNVVDSGSRYLATTTFTDRAKNADILAGDWRPINLQAYPFLLGEPRVVIPDGNEVFPDKVIGVWAVADLVEQYGPFASEPARPETRR
jgi:hypothetical protein